MHSTLVSGALDRVALFGLGVVADDLNPSVRNASGVFGIAAFEDFFICDVCSSTNLHRPDVDDRAANYAAFCWGAFGAWSCADALFVGSHECAL